MGIVSNIFFNSDALKGQIITKERNINRKIKATCKYINHKMAKQVASGDSFQWIGKNARFICRETSSGYGILKSGRVIDDFFKTCLLEGVYR